MKRSPPRAAEAMLNLALPAGVVGRSIRGDLREEFAWRTATHGGWRARFWYWREAAGVLIRAFRERLTGKRAWLRRAQSHSSPGSDKGDPMYQQVLADLVHAFRSLRRAPGFAVVSVLTLGIGIGANAAVFSVVDAVLLNPLPFTDPDQLFIINSAAPGISAPPEFGAAAEFYLEYGEHAEGIEALGLYSGFGGTLTVDNEAERLRMSEVNTTLFGTLGVTPELGRLPSREEVFDGASVVLISHTTWVRRFAADPDVIGRSIEIQQSPFTVIGVMGPEFRFPEPQTAAWIPEPINPDRITPGRFGWRMVARVKQGVDPDELQRQLVPLAARLPQLYPDNPRYVRIMIEGRYRPVVRALKEEIVGDLQQPLAILMATVAVVLLIAAANVANLWLVRAETRQRDVAIRQALGAGRARLIRAQLAEAVVLATLGGVAGVAFALLAVPALLAAAPQSVPGIEDVRLDGSVLAFTAAVSLLSALLFGLAPAIRYSAPRVVERLRATGSGMTAGRQRHAARNALVIVQSALAIILLVASGLLLRSFWQLMDTDAGFDPDGVFSFQLALPRDEFTGAHDSAAFHMQFLDRLAALPGVVSVGAVRNLPLDESARTVSTVSYDAPDEPDFIAISFVAPGFFETMRIELLEGRTFTRADHEIDWEAGYVVVNQTLADKFWPSQNAIGKRLRASNTTDGWETVIGVVHDVRDLDLRQPARPTYYVPLVGRAGDDGWIINSPAYVVRSSRPDALAPIVREQVRQLDSAMPMYAVYTMSEVIANSVARLRFTLIALGVAAGLALVLGTVGLYGILSYVVSQRRNEIGLRMALGASQQQVRRMVVLQGTRLAAIGTVLGVLGAAGVTRLLQEMLYDTAALDPATFIGVGVAMLLVGVLASYAPARRASAVDPLESMRSE